jgi:Family of unknown function (DUF6278)
MTDGRKETDDVSGAATPVDDEETVDATLEAAGPSLAGEAIEETAVADPPPAVAELAAACVRFVATRYGIHLEFDADTLSLVDQWVRDAREELKDNPSLVGLVQGAAGAYLGEVIRRTFGATWSTEGEHGDWRLMMATVYCAFNPLGMVREALMLGEAEGWHAHFELDPAEREDIEARLAALPEVSEDEYYAPSTRFDVVNIVVDALREKMRAGGLSDVRFGAADYAGV